MTFAFRNCPWLRLSCSTCCYTFVSRVVVRFCFQHQISFQLIKLILWIQNITSTEATFPGSSKPLLHLFHFDFRCWSILDDGYIKMHADHLIMQYGKNTVGDNGSGRGMRCVQIHLLGILGSCWWENESIHLSPLQNRSIRVFYVNCCASDGVFWVIRKEWMLLWCPKKILWW